MIFLSHNRTLHGFGCGCQWQKPLSMIETEKNKGGRPRVDATPITVRMPPADLSRLDDWILAQPEPRPSRPEAIRRLIEKALGELAGGPAPPEKTEADRASDAYSATRIVDHRAVEEWRAHATDDENAAHRLAQHLKTKLEQGAPGYGPDDSVTLMRPDGKIVTVARVSELIERLRGWKLSPRADQDLDADP